MLLLATTGMIQIGRAYYKGITNSKTQELARSTVDEMTDIIQNGGSKDIIHNANFYGEIDPVQPKYVDLGNGLESYSICIGTSRYSFVLNKQVGDGTAKVKHALWADTQKAGSTCTPVDLTQARPADGSTDTASSVKAREMLVTNMRLVKYDVKPNLKKSGATVNVRVLYGDDEIIETNGDTDYTNDTCKPIRVGGQFCAFSELSSFVKERQ